MTTKLLAICIAICASGNLAVGNDIPDLIKTIHSVGREGAGNVEAGAAWKQLSQYPADQLPAILKGLEGASSLSANWIIAAVDTIAERTLREGGKLPQKSLEGIVLNKSLDPKARTLAYRWLVAADSTASDRLIPGMLDDPSVDFRRQAVEQLLNEVTKRFGSKKDGKASLLERVVYRRALDSARDLDQIQTVVRRLRSMGESVDLPRHFGFLMRWKVVGPFDNTDRKGFAVAYPPEKEVDLDATYEGSKGKVKWQDYATSDDFGMVDFNKPFGALKQQLAYAFTTFESPNDQTAELRLGCKNAWKIWLNGKLVFARNEYHRGMRLDQYQMKVKLNRGRNTILVKACQNEMMESWTKEWQFQLRVCDATGTAKLSTDRKPTPSKKKSTKRKTSGR